MSFMYELKCSLTFLLWYHYLDALQDHTILNGQLFSEGPIRLYLTWHFSVGTCHPCIMVCLGSASSSSSWVAILIWFKLSLLTLNWLVIWWIWSLGSLMASFCPPNQDKQSASWLVLPGIYFTIKWYVKVLMSIPSNLGVAWLILLDNMASSGFWSVSSRKWLTYRKWWNISIAQATASDSNAIGT